MALWASCDAPGANHNRLEGDGFLCGGNIALMTMMFKEVSVMLEEREVILVPEECAEILRVGMNEIYKLLNTKQISGYKVGKTWRVPKENLINYINSKIE